MQTILNLLKSPELLLIVITISFILKIYLLCLLIPAGLKSMPIKHCWLFLLGTLVGTLFGDFAWLIKLFRELNIIQLPYSSLVFFIRISWGFLVLQYQSLALFLESLLAKTFRFTMRHKILLTGSIGMSLYFIYIAFFEGTLTNESTRVIHTIYPLLSRHVPTEVKMMSSVVYYAFIFLMMPSIGIVLRRSHRDDFPIIINHQLSILLKFLISSYLLVEILQLITFVLCPSKAFLYPTVSISTLILSYAIYYSIKKVLGIRFLNATTHVQSSPNYNLIHDFKHVLEQLSHITSLQEVCQITQTFFKDTFNIPLRKALLYVRSQDAEHTVTFDAHKVASLVENFLNTHDSAIEAYIKQSKILIYDELEFSNFHQENNIRTALLTFLDNLNAEIFLPIYDKNHIIGYIIVERHLRKKKLYGTVERDEMIIFASYLCNIINLLQHHNLKTLFQQEKQLKEELHQRKNEIKQYKESLRSFINTGHQKSIGIVFYKNRNFIYANQAAKEIINVNLNQQSGHPLSKICKKMALQVIEYKSPQSALTIDDKGNRIALFAVLNLQQNNVIIIVHNPEVSDIITNHAHLLQDPARWDYLLYLETTKSGKLVNKWLPGTSELILHVKLDLLQASLNNKALLLDVVQDDRMAMVELMHHLSGRERLYTIRLEQPCISNKVAIQLFGINPLFGIEQPHAPLLKKLDENGTLFIENVHHLSMEAQQYLAEYITYGYYRLFKSEQHMNSRARIICSTDQNLMQLTQEGRFCNELYTELKKNSLIMPTLESLPEQELFNLADHIAEQSVKTTDFKNLFELTQKEKFKLAQNRPTSLQELRTKIESLLMKKSKTNNVEHEAEFDSAYYITDPELTAAARLGKHALRDEKTMELLWQKFQKNQNRIAAFLGVNRSSVNRRCKQYNLE